MSDDTEILQDWIPGTPNYRTRAYIILGIGLAYTLFVLITTAMFLVVARNKRSGLEKRSVKLIVFQALGCYFVGVDGLVTAALNNWACFGKLWLFNIGFIMSLAAMSARAFHLFVVYRVHELASQLSSKTPGAINASSKSIIQNESEKSIHTDSRLISTVVHKPSRLNSTLYRANPYDRIRLEQRLRKYRRLMRFTTDRMLLLYVGLLLLFIVVLTFVINATDKQFRLRPMNIVCEFMWGFIPALSIIVFYFFLMFPIILWRVWRNNDAYGIRNDLIVCDTVGIVVMIVTLVWVLRLHETQQIWPGLSYIWVYALFIHVSSVLVPLIYAIKHMQRANEGAVSQQIYARHDGLQAPVYTLGVSSRRADFNRMLDSALEYQRFRSFAASCFCSELTSFVEEYQILKSQVLALLDHQTTKVANDSCDSSTAAIMHHEAPLELNRLSQSIVDNILAQDMDYAEDFQRTSATVSILETVRDKYANINPDTLMFPPQLAPKIFGMYREFVDPASITSVNASSLVVRRITERINSNFLHISFFDELKDEVLLMLYSDVYTRFIRKLSNA
ncbi:hypothetical protein IW140_003301 [Coemansia sp. RSA 1813]|nr:hypothetical protein EV178_002920 [Coemansia sp. RSA 1646]KAJ1771709.1 hypothetical protein LPJ74_002136 [Coemansia sp. RSA 1843]KAJ2089654.1 hypothetical protein IW138_003252 [Coemansia sp. RSA 986]KAJ2214150.1 hypothetical protein EV179_003289 [Coemansia sp. RSA 487]KAJ2569209.1 hypothetical protein IW140_003301 [Coemansia sp. RSA 1813]